MDTYVDNRERNTTHRVVLGKIVLGAFLRRFLRRNDGKQGEELATLSRHILRDIGMDEETIKRKREEEFRERRRREDGRP